MKISYVIGDITETVKRDKPRCIGHCVNNQGGWGSGFVLSLDKKWPHVGDWYRYWAWGKDFKPFFKEDDTGYGMREGMTGKFELGQVQWVKADENTTVFNIVGQHRTGIREIAGIRIPPVDYRSLREGFARIKEFYLKSVKQDNAFDLDLVRLGCGLAGGKWSEIEKILNEVFGDTLMDITVYDFAPGIPILEEKHFEIKIHLRAISVSNEVSDPEIFWDGAVWSLDESINHRHVQYHNVYRLKIDFTGDR